MALSMEDLPAKDEIGTEKSTLDGGHVKGLKAVEILEVAKTKYLAGPSTLDTLQLPLVPQIAGVPDW